MSHPKEIPCLITKYSHVWANTLAEFNQWSSNLQVTSQLSTSYLRCTLPHPMSHTKGRKEPPKSHGLLRSTHSNLLSTFFGRLLCCLHPSLRTKLPCLHKCFILWPILATVKSLHDSMKLSKAPKVPHTSFPPETWHILGLTAYFTITSPPMCLIKEIDNFPNDLHGCIQIFLSPPLDLSK
jgi:hypothetical protein